MRFLKEAKFELDEKGEEALGRRIEDFLRSGGLFTLSDWESLSDVEQRVAKQIKAALKLEEALLLRRAMTASSLEDAVDMFKASGDLRTASKLLLDAAVRSVGCQEVRN